MTRRILIVDDDSDHTASIASLLEDKYEVEVASNGFSALDRMRGGGFDLILLDIVMPGLDGVGFLQELKTSVPVILITASRTGAETALGLGVEACLFKPLNVTRLESKITQVLGPPPARSRSGMP